MKTIKLITLIIVLFSGTISAQMKSAHEKSTSSDKATELKLSMRDLWQEHVAWTRNVVLCIVDGLPGTDQAVNRLLRNQDDIGNAVKPFYGEEAGKQLSILLREHITVAAEVVKAAKANDKTALDDANKRWYANADQIGEFLGKANPNWNAGEMKTMMHDHLKLLTEEVVNRIKKDYNADVASYDKSQEQISQMSDMLADGIVKQFPEKF
ncbi:MAG TPA: hypothetical protein VHI78_09665 [Bacteroidales bacterium]|jgi:hypothetical protein|nr:hypothetical protein [Bacteroidales bacterium]